MKKILAFILAAATFICVFAACAKDEKPNDNFELSFGGYEVSLGGYDASHETDDPSGGGYKGYIVGYLKHAQDFSDKTMGFLGNNTELSREEFIDAWKDRNGSWWRTIFSSMLSFKEIYSMLEPPTAADRVYRDQIFDQGDAIIASAIQALQNRLGFDPTSKIDDPGPDPWEPGYTG